MKHHFKLFSPTWAALAASALIAACGGGGSASAPSGSEDKTPPTVTITDSVESGNATGVITFTFNFNEAVGGFTESDIIVTGGQGSEFAMAVDNKSARLQVTPTANSTGTVQVSVAAGAFRDLAENVSTAATSASQTFDTTVPAPSAYISFDENPAIATSMGAFGGALPEVTTGPSGGTANSLKIVKRVGTYLENGNEVPNKTWGGTYFTVPRVPFTSTQKAITARVYSTVANAVIRLKVEVPSGASVEVEGTTIAQANTWTTVTWNFSNADLAANYTVLAVTPDFSRALDDATYYIDEINMVDTPVATSPSAAAVNPTAANLVTLFSDASGYTALTNGTFTTDWSDATYAEETVASNNVLKYSALNFVGIVPANPIDISTATYVNMDIWTPDLTKFRVKLVNFLNGNYDLGTNKEHEITLNLDDAKRSTWYRVRIPMADFTGLTERTHVKQLILSVGDGIKGTVYVDNIFFSTN